MSIASYLSVHGVTRISAHAFTELSSAPLIISLEGEDWQGGRSEIVIHTDNAKLALALVEAINNACAGIAAKETAVQEEAV